ncbi:MAG: Uma2 family endonuclease [Fimbriimonadaceae bacterium]|nr:Uma2 family endonuclease [Fimbriimonadaceae bacterium]
MSEPAGWISAEQYLAAEARSEGRHEYIGGHVFALAGARQAHNTIVSNVLARLWQHLRGTPCRVFSSDMLLRVATDRFYYPDILVGCDEYPDEALYIADARVVVEVTLDSTRRADLGEKAAAYLGLPSLSAYAVIAGDACQVALHERTSAGVSTALLCQPDAILRLDCLAFQIALGEIYERTSLA